MDELNITKSTSFAMPSEFDAKNTSTAAWEWASYTSSAITVLLLLVVVGMRKRIRLAIAIIKEAGAAMGAMPGLLALPVLVLLAVLALLVYWIYALSYVATIDKLSWADAGVTVGETVTSACAADPALHARCLAPTAAATVAANSSADGRHHRHLAPQSPWATPR